MGVEFFGRVPQLGIEQWCVGWKLYNADGTPLPHDKCPMAIAVKEGRSTWGVHDVKWCDDHGTLTEVGVGHQQVPIADYEKNLRQLLTRLKKTGAKLIWCSTTPIPAKSKGRVQGDEVKYNQVAARMIQDEGLAIDDLYRFALPQHAQIQVPADVHYTPEGYAKLAGQVVRSIESALRAK